MRGVCSMVLTITAGRCSHGSVPVDRIENEDNSGNSCVILCDFVQGWEEVWCKFGGEAEEGRTEIRLGLLPSSAAICGAYLARTLLSEKMVSSSLSLHVSFFCQDNSAIGTIQNDHRHLKNEIKVDKRAWDFYLSMLAPHDIVFGVFVQAWLVCRFACAFLWVLTNSPLSPRLAFPYSPLPR